jgi:hypothetical protein
MSLQKLAYNGDSKIILNLVNQVNQLIDGGVGSTDIHFYEDTTGISDLADIPLNSAGHILLNQGHHPFDFSGDVNVAFINVGYANGLCRLLMVSRTGTGEVYSNTSNSSGSSWTGWKSMIDAGGVTDVQVDGSSVVNDGIAEIDLANNYYNKSQTDTLLSAKQDTLTAGDGIKISSDVISLDYLSVVNGEVCITFEE